MTSRSSSGALEAVERILNRGGEPGDVLRQVVEALHERAVLWVGIAFVEESRPELAVSAGGAQPDEVQRHAVRWQGERVAELRASADADEALLARIAVIISPHCLARRDAAR